MFKKLTTEEKLRNAEAENKQLMQRQTEIEDAVLELAGIVVEEATNG